LAAVAIGTLILLTPNQARAEVCALESAERKWIERTLNLWQSISCESLRLKPVTLPWIVLFDETCVWHVLPDARIPRSKLPNDVATTRLFVARRTLDVYGFSHNGQIELPNNEQIPPRLLTFASTYNNGDNAFLVFSMPSIWRQAPHLKSETHLDVLIRSVFVHELTHTRHRNFFDQISALERQHQFSEAFDDNIIQNRFGKREDFRRAYEEERDVLYKAVLETKRRRKRELAKSVLDSIRQRHRQFFNGEDAFYAEIEDIFLIVEGVAQWAAYKSATAEGLSSTNALKLIRRGGKQWSQDEGLALFLVIDSLLPRWQEKTFGETPISVTSLLREAVNRKTSGPVLNKSGHPDTSSLPLSLCCEV
jgi:hypothetical protein